MHASDLGARTPLQSHHVGGEVGGAAQQAAADAVGIGTEREISANWSGKVCFTGSSYHIKLQSSSSRPTTMASEASILP